MVPDPDPDNGADDDALDDAADDPELDPAVPILATTPLEALEEASWVLAAAP